MAVTYRKATQKDIELLIRLRLDYLTEDRGNLPKMKQIQSSRSFRIILRGS